METPPIKYKVKVIVKVKQATPLTNAYNCSYFLGSLNFNSTNSAPCKEIMQFHVNKKLHTIFHRNNFTNRQLQQQTC